MYVCLCRAHVYVEWARLRRGCGGIGARSAEDSVNEVGKRASRKARYDGQRRRTARQSRLGRPKGRNVGGRYRDRCVDEKRVGRDCCDKQESDGAEPGARGGSSPSRLASGRAESIKGAEIRAWASKRRGVGDARHQGEEKNVHSRSRQTCLAAWPQRGVWSWFGAEGWEGERKKATAEGAQAKKPWPPQRSKGRQRAREGGGQREKQNANVPQQKNCEAGLRRRGRKIGQSSECRGRGTRPMAFWRGRLDGCRWLSRGSGGFPMRARRRLMMAAENGGEGEAGGSTNRVRVCDGWCFPLACALLGWALCRLACWGGGCCCLGRDAGCILAVFLSTRREMWGGEAYSRLLPAIACDRRLPQATSRVP